MRSMWLCVRCTIDGAEKVLFVAFEVCGKNETAAFFAAHGRGWRQSLESQAAHENAEVTV